MYRSHKIRLYPTKAQAVRIQAWMDTCRAVYNIGLEQRWDALCKQGKWLTYIDQQNQIPELTKEFDWISDVSADCLRTSALRRLDSAFKHWSIQKISKRPKFKKRGFSFSLEFGDKTRFKVKPKHIRFEKLGNIKAKITFKCIGKPRIAGIYKDVDKWYARVVYDIPDNQTCQLPGKVGIDLGVTDIVADSNGNLIKSPAIYKKSLRKLKKLNRVLSLKKKGSKRRNKTKLKVARLHRKIRNQRNDFLHKLSTKYAESQGVVVMEDLKISNMVRNRHLSRSISDQGWGVFRDMLRYKLEAQQVQLVLVNPRYTSQACNICLTRGSRVGKLFTCEAHGVFDADLNAAKNILNRYQSAKTVDLTIVEAKVVNEAVETISTRKKV